MSGERVFALYRRGIIIDQDALSAVEVEGRSGTRFCGLDHLDMGCDTISRWLKTRVRHARPVADHSGVFNPANQPPVQSKYRTKYPC